MESDNNREYTEQLSQALIKLFDDLNQRYSLDIQLNFDSFSQSLNHIIKPIDKAAMELYLNEAYSRIKLILYLKYLNSVALLSEKILNPDYFLSEKDKFNAIKKLDKFIKNFEEICKEIYIPESEVELEKLTENPKNKPDINDPRIRKFLSSLTESIRSGINKESINTKNSIQDISNNNVFKNLPIAAIDTIKQAEQIKNENSEKFEQVD